VSRESPRYGGAGVKAKSLKSLYPMEETYPDFVTEIVQGSGEQIEVWFAVQPTSS